MPRASELIDCHLPTEAPRRPDRDRAILHRARRRARQGIRVSVWLCIVCNLRLASAEDWLEFRGPTQQGHASTAAATRWSETENVTWKTPVPGTGHSSPIVLGDQVWITTAISKGTQPLQEKGVIPREVALDLHLVAICLDRKTGKIVHTVRLMDVPDPQPIHPMNTYASPTPVAEPGRLYCHFGTNGTYCVNTHDGTVLWKRVDLKLDHQAGAGSSPMLWDDRLIFHMDGRDQQYIIALDKHTGETVWKVPRSGKMNDRSDMRKAYAMPLAMKIGDENLLISPAADWVYAYSPSTGEERWRVPYETLGFSNTPRPVADDQHIYVCTGFMKSQLLAIAFDPSDATVEPTVAWRYTRQVPQISSPLLVDKELYFVTDQGGILTCVDTESGEMLWRERLGGNHAASPVLAGGLIYVAGQDGTTRVIRPGRTYDEVARNDLPKGIFASPAIADGSLFLRTEGAVYRIDP